jgi:hypothetical protein
MRSARLWGKSGKASDIPGREVRSGHSDPGCKADEMGALIVLVCKFMGAPKDSGGERLFVLLNVAHSMMAMASTLASENRPWRASPEPPMAATALQTFVRRQPRCA